MRGLQRMAPGLGKPLTPLTQQQIAGARANAGYHNAAALAAIERGDKSYTTGGGSVQPTTSMNGKVRNTDADQHQLRRTLSVGQAQSSYHAVLIKITMFRYPSGSLAIMK